MTQESMESNFTSMHSTVEFLDVLDQYSFNADLHCKLKFNDYVPQEGDRIAIFKLGWTLVKDYVVFEWVPTSPNDKHCCVSFNRHILPKNTSELYQICYLSSENELHGASSPLQFYSGENLMSASCILSSEAINNLNATSKSQTMSESDKDREIYRLKEENAILKESLKALISQKSGSDFKHYDKDIQEVKELLNDLKRILSVHQEEIDMLKSKIRDGGEEYRKLYLEKAKVEKKYEKLRNKREGRKSLDEEIKPVNNSNFDIGDLKSMPPFPSIFK